MSGIDDFDPFDTAPAVSTATVSAPAQPPRARTLARVPQAQSVERERRRYEPRHEREGRAVASSIAASGRQMPWSEDAEQHVIACCLLDGGDGALTLRRAQNEGITAESFFSAANRVLWETLVGVHERTGLVTLESLAEELQRQRLLEAVGGAAYLVQVTGKIPTTAHAGYFIAAVREKEKLRAFIKKATGVVEQCYSFTGGMDEFAAEIEAGWAELLHDARRSSLPEAMPLVDFDYPTSDDPNILLGSDDFLGRGGGMMFISHGGAGKSSVAINAAMSWGLGEPWMGIRSNGALRILIIQAEDSARYTGKVVRSYAYKHNLTKEQTDALRQRVVTAKVKGVTGAAFMRILAGLVEKHLPDLVIINPVYLYAEGDISKPEVAQPFLVGLDAVNKDERFGYMLIHHTGKPSQKSGNGKRAELQDWETIYMGFGSSYFANWPRCSVLLEPRGTEKGKYWLRLGKAGMNAGVTRKVQRGDNYYYEPCTKIAVRHSTDTMEVGGRKRPCIYWEFDETADAEDTTQEQQASNDGRRKRVAGGGKFNTSEVLNLFPVGAENAEPLARIVKKAVDTLAMKRGTFMDYRLDFINTGAVMKDDMGSYFRPKV